MKVASAHLNDGTETAVVGAAARSFDHIDLTPEQSVTLKHACSPVRHPDFTVLKFVRCAGWVVNPALIRPITQSANVLEPAASLDGAQQLAEGNLSLTPNEIVDIHRLIGLGSQAGIVTSNHDFAFRLQRSDKIDDTRGRPALECHDGQSHDFGV